MKKNTALIVKLVVAALCCVLLAVYLIKNSADKSAEEKRTDKVLENKAEGLKKLTERKEFNPFNDK